MGKFGILIKAAAAVVLLAAAHTVSEARPGIEAGYVNAQYRSKFVASSDIADSFCMNGFFVGANSDTRLYSNKLFFNTGLYYNMLKRSEVQDLSIARMSGTRSEHSLSVPLQLKYRFYLRYSINMFIYAGPTLDFGFVSDVKYSVRSEALGLEGNISYNYYNGRIRSSNIPEEYLRGVEEVLPDARYNWFDVSMGGGVGFEFLKFIELRAGYDWGLLNRYRQSYSDDMLCRRNQVYVALGFRF